MGFRTVVIKQRCKLDLKMNYLVCRSQEEIKVFIPEISYLILESTAISVTTALLSELVKNKVKIIFCDEKHSPESELVPLYGSYNSAKKIKRQIKWDEDIKSRVWAKIVEFKIINQSRLLKKFAHFKEGKMLEQYALNIEPNDASNREGHSAKVYFNALFGMEFSRGDASKINFALNYGYTILLSCFNREIVKNGYLTQLGIWHKNEFNDFNFSCDLVEPFRPIVDEIATNLHENDDFKHKMLEIFEKQVKICGKLQYLENAIAIYCQHIFDALEEGDEGLVCNYE